MHLSESGNKHPETHQIFNIKIKIIIKICSVILLIQDSALIVRLDALSVNKRFVTNCDNQVLLVFILG